MPRKPKSKPVAEHVAATEHVEAERLPDEVDRLVASIKPLTEAQLKGEEAVPAVVTEDMLAFDPVSLDRKPEPARPMEPQRKMRGVLGYHFAGGGSVQMTDTGSKLGVMFDLPEGKPPAEVLDAVREERTYGSTVKRGLSYDAREKQWVKRVSDSPVGDRLEVEGRVKDAAERYRESKARQAEQGR